LDLDFELSLANAAKEEVESMRGWEMLKKCNTSLTADSNSKALPTDFFLPQMILLGSDTSPLQQIPFEQKEIFANNSQCWYLDLANSVYYLLGSQTGQTIRFYYSYATPDILAGTSPVWPERFHKIIAYKMAKLFYGADQTERNFAWDPMWTVEHDLLVRMMVDWDVKLKKRAIENGLSIRDMQNGLATDSYGMDVSNTF
jgi:hypothetical protein